MFWASFYYDFKGPCHIQKQETTVDRKLADKDLTKINEALKFIYKAEWELNNLMSCLQIDRKKTSRVLQQ